MSIDVKPHAAALRACAASMEAAGIGADPKKGHARVARDLADHLEAEANAGRVPQVVGNIGYLSAAGGDPATLTLAASGTTENGLSIQALARIEARRLNDPLLNRLMRDLKLQAGDGSHGGLYTVSEIDERFEAAKKSSTSVYGRVSGAEVKTRLLQAGLMANVR